MKEQSMETLPFTTLSSFGKTKNLPRIEKGLHESLDQIGRKIIVLDDDPTGIQTVHGVFVYTDWSVATLCEGLLSDKPLFFILTNSRSLVESETQAVHEEIARNLKEASALTKTDFLVLSRGDSTLRGHYPLETETLSKNLGKEFDAEILVPFFLEGGRYTLNDIQYVKEGDTLIPAGETEFALDRTFGYKNSNLPAWIEEKSARRFLAKDVVSIGLQELRSGEIDAIYRKLDSVSHFSKIVVNAIDYADLTVFSLALCKALEAGKEYIIRCAASFVKVLGGISDRPLLTKDELVKKNRNGGILLVGSHVKKTTLQLEHLRENCKDLHWIEFDQHRILQDGGLEQETRRVRTLVEGYLGEGNHVVVHTRRDRLDLPNVTEQEQLQLTNRISDALVSVIGDLAVRPSFVIAKGGITSSDVGTKALLVHKALVLGQVQKGIPVWETGNESKFPHLGYIIFPGNVGEVSTLSAILQMLLY
jgi:uncharacterized protein YgbK (DUF1537 family)